MKETDFIKQNQKKWARFEKLSSQKNNDPDEVSELFTEITEDLSYARTFYPRRSVRVYLNQLSQRVFTSLYKQRKQPIGSFAKFWTQTVPLEMYRARYNLLVATAFFLLAVLIGAISQHYDPEFVEIVLGEGYVSATEQRIADGDPMGIYGESPQGSMFFTITVNNIRVAFMAFTLGILGTLGTYWILLQNGIMLGAFQWWFKAKGLLFATFLAIWIHGAFEISAIVIAGAAGLTVGNGLIFPRSYTRVQSLVFSAKRGMIIMLSLVPFFIAAGALESFITRYYLVLPTAVKLIIILGSFAIIVAYYVVYPFIVARKFPEKIKVEELPRFIPERKIEWFKIRKPGEIFTDTFTLFIQHMGKLSKVYFNVIFPLALVLLAVIFANEFFRFDFTLYWYETFGSLFGTHTDFSLYKFLGWPFLLALMISLTYFILHDKSEDRIIFSYIKFTLKHIIWLYIYAIMLFSIFVFTPGGLLFFLLFIGPFLVNIPSVIVLEETNFFSAIPKAFDLRYGSYGDSLLSFIALTAITIIFFFLLHNPFELGIITLIDDLLKKALIVNVKYYSVIIAIVNSVIYLIYLFFVLGICFISFALSYYSHKEKITANGLFKRLTSFGKRNRNFESDIDFE